MNTDFTKDFFCRLLEKILNMTMDNKYYDVHIRHIYKNKNFFTRTTKSFLELKTFRKITLIKPEDLDNRYKERYLWLCYDISSKATCDICGSICSKDGLLYANKCKNENIHLICPSCAYMHNYTNSIDACMNCSNIICGVSIAKLVKLEQDRKEIANLTKELELISIRHNKKKKKKKGKRK